MLLFKFVLLVKNRFLKLFLFLLILLIFPKSGKAQKSTQFTLGGTFFYSKDKIVSESIYEGRTTSFSLEERFSNTKILRAQYLYGKLYSENDNEWHILSPKLSFYLFTKNHPFRDLSNQFGIGLNLEGLWINSSFNTNGIERDGRKSGFFNSYLSFEYSNSIVFNTDYKAELGLSIPFIYYALRPGYSILDPDRTIGESSTALNVARSGELETFKNQKKILLKFTFSKSVSQHLEILFYYNYHFQKIAFPKEFGSIDQTVNTGIRWKR